MRHGLWLPLILTAAGCEKAKPTAGVPAVVPSPAAVAAAAPAVPDAPGMNRWSDSELEKVVRDELKLTELTLTKVNDNRYSGTGKNAAGVLYFIRMAYRAGEYRIDYKTDRGGQGDSHWSAEGVEKKFGK